MTISDIQKDLETRFKDMLDLVEVQAGVSERENFKSSIRTSIEKAFEEINIVEAQEYHTTKKSETRLVAGGWNAALEQLKSNQAKFLNGEKNEK